MLSRVADSIYWMCRYIERAENIARFIDVNLILMLDLPYENNEQWEPLIYTTGDTKQYKKEFETFNKKNVIEFLSFSKNNPNSILSTVITARENARTIREIISSEMWEQINAFYYFVRDASSNSSAFSDEHDFYSKIKNHSHLFTGIMDTTMSHGEGWHFGRMGRLLERADKTSRILDVKYFMLLPSLEDVGTPIDNLQWAALLKSASAFEMYRKKFRRITPNNVADFLILNREFPRSVQYCLSKAQDSLWSITDSPEGTYNNTAEQRLGKLCSEIAYTDITEIMSQGLHEYLDGLQLKLNSIDEGIIETFINIQPS